MKSRLTITGITAVRLLMRNHAEVRYDVSEIPGIEVAESDKLIKRNPLIVSYLATTIIAAVIPDIELSTTE